MRIFYEKIALYLSFSEYHLLSLHSKNLKQWDMKKIMIAFWLLCSTIALSAQTLRQSVENGVQTSVRQSENHEWREAFATC